MGFPYGNNAYVPFYPTVPYIITLPLGRIIIIVLEFLYSHLSSGLIYLLKSEYFELRTSSTGRTDLGLFLAID